MKDSLTPRDIVNRLNQYIVGQEGAKKSVAIALRNRYRRSMLTDKLRDEITPKNILMIGQPGSVKQKLLVDLQSLLVHRLRK